MGYYDMSEYFTNMEYMQAKLSKHVSIKTWEDFKKIKSHPMTKVIQYPEFKESYDYVHSHFPHFNVQQVVILEADKKFLKKLGYGGAGGLYSSLWKSVVMTDTETQEKTKNKFAIRAKITKDEVVVHELLHYCSDAQGKTNTSSDIEEEFAYGWSYGYLKNKGYTDMEIIDNNYLPYLVSMGDYEQVLCASFKEEKISLDDFNTMEKSEKKKLFLKMRNKIHEKSLEFARDRGKQIIRIYAGKLKISPDDNADESNEEQSRFDLMDV